MDDTILQEKCSQVYFEHPSKELKSGMVEVQKSIFVNQIQNASRFKLALFYEYKGSVNR